MDGRFIRTGETAAPGTVVLVDRQAQSLDYALTEARKTPTLCLTSLQETTPSSSSAGAAAPFRSYKKTLGPDSQSRRVEVEA